MVTVLANGCFDLLHAGHIAHLREAAGMGDRLVVALTADAFVGKGPGRPIQRWEDRAAVLGALRFVDQVVESTSAYTAILKVRPTIFVKGADYKIAEIEADREACRIVGAQIRFTTSPKKSTTEILKRVRECALR